MIAGAVLWQLYFAVGFRAFSRGIHSNRLGMLLTVGLPIAAFVLFKNGLLVLASILPPMTVYEAVAFSWWYGLPGTLLGLLLALFISWGGLSRCDAELRRWYDQNHGRKLAD